MKQWKRVAIACLALMLCVGCAMAEETVTITADEYERLQKYSRLEEILATVEQNFLFEYDVDEMIEGAAQGMLGVLEDDYTYYYTPMDMTSQIETMTGEYGGLGIEVFANPNDLTITIRRVFYNGPAQLAGILPNDKIIQVNGEDVTAYDMDKAVSIMRGEVGGEVTLTILRETETFEVTCKRAIVQTEIINYEMLDDGIGYMRLHYFEGGLMSQFEAMRSQFTEQGARGLIIDLRDNPGGLLDLALDLADQFLDEVLIMSTEDRYGRKLSLYGEEGAWDIPLVLLVNGYSASAAEVLAAALADNGRAKMVGEKTFGKGIVQSVITFMPDGAGMQLTTQYWLTPEGITIHGEGILPDVEVVIAEDAADENFQLVKEKDNQLQAAIALLLEELAE
ncbi:MAG: S41 family peptidase [Oscillospiraceae bacterium]|jgi:carboxyl-terminal processing protease|nr:S41 family peptidase [Oscillospiraceae bacterium]